MNDDQNIDLIIVTMIYFFPRSWFSFVSERQSTFSSIFFFFAYDWKCSKFMWLKRMYLSGKFPAIQRSLKKMEIKLLFLRYLHEYNCACHFTGTAVVVAAFFFSFAFFCKQRETFVNYVKNRLNFSPSLWTTIEKSIEFQNRKKNYTNYQRMFTMWTSHQPQKQQFRWDKEKLRKKIFAFRKCWRMRAPNLN